MPYRDELKGFALSFNHCRQILTQFCLLVRIEHLNLHFGWPRQIVNKGRFNRWLLKLTSLLVGGRYERFCNICYVNAFGCSSHHDFWEREMTNSYSRSTELWFPFPHFLTLQMSYQKPVWKDFHFIPNAKWLVTFKGLLKSHWHLFAYLNIGNWLADSIHKSPFFITRQCKVPYLLFLLSF